MLSMTYLVISHEVHIRYAEPFPEIHASTNSAFWDVGPCQVGLVFRLSASHTVGREFASQSGHTIIKWYKLPPCIGTHALGLEFGSAA